MSCSGATADTLASFTATPSSEEGMRLGSVSFVSRFSQASACRSSRTLQRLTIRRSNSKSLAPQVQDARSFGKSVGEPSNVLILEGAERPLLF